MVLKASEAINISRTGRQLLYNYRAFYRAYSPKMRTTPAQLKLSPETLINHLSYSHFELLVNIPDDFKRTFYEIECIRGNWSVRELKRQIASLYSERSGVSKDKTTSIRLFSVTPKRPLEVNLPNPVFAFDANGFIFSAPAI